jgi:zinc-binding alcohol dehydrogenase/oxidoreductase
MGMSRQGTFAECVAVPARNVHLKPAYMNFDYAGAFVLSCLTAWRMLFTRARLGPGETSPAPRYRRRRCPLCTSVG